MMSFVVALGGGVSGLVACGGETPIEAGDDARFAISVAALSLPGVDDACYTLTVYDGPAAQIGEDAGPVWARAGICADGFGDGRGGVTYVGACDASIGTNTVELVLERLCAGGSCDAPGAVTLADYVNPCTAATPCRLERPCTANADTSVAFDLTILRSAKQGFFDVAVSFEDVFCSAKLDCERDGGPLTLLHDPATQARGPTTVLGYACTTGPETATVLNWQDVTLTCSAPGGGSWAYTFDPSGRGNLWPTFPEGHPRVVFQAAAYPTVEALTSGGASLAKGAWNVAIGIDEALVDALDLTCTLDVVGAPSDGRLAGGALPAEQVYPTIAWSETLYAGGERVCSQSALDAAGSGVRTRYVRPGEPAPALPRCYDIGADAFCAAGEPAGDGVCDAGDAGAPDCDGVCDAGDAGDGADCDGVCDAGDAGDGADCAVSCECVPGVTEPVTFEASGVIDQSSSLAGAELGEPFTVAWTFDPCVADTVPDDPRRGAYPQEGGALRGVWQFGAVRRESGYVFDVFDDFTDSSGDIDMVEITASSFNGTALQLIAPASAGFRTSDALTCEAPAFEGVPFDTNFARLCDGGGCAQGTVTALRRVSAVAPRAAGRVFFVADDGASGAELWSTDCTLAGTTLAGDVNASGGGGFDTEGCEADFDPFTCEQLAQMCGQHPAADPYCGFAWGECTRRLPSGFCASLRDQCQFEPGANEYCLSGGGAGSDPEELTAFDGYLYFTADDGVHGRELWRTDGVTAELYEDLRSAELPAFESTAASGFIPRMAVLGDRLYFTARDDSHGIELFSTDGAGPIALVHDFNPNNEAGGVPAWLTVAGDRLYFEIGNAPSAQGDQLHWVDTTGALGQIPLPVPSSATQTLFSLKASGSALYFTANDASGARRVYVVPAGATAATEVALTVASVGETDLFLPFAGGLLVEAAGGGLARVDGATATTLGPASVANLEYGVAIGGRAFFSGFVGGVSPGLYVSDGGAAALADAGPATLLVAHDGGVYYRGDAARVIATWDEAGGERVVYDGGQSSFVNALRAYEDTRFLVFAAQDGDAHGLSCVDTGTGAAQTVFALLGQAAPSRLVQVRELRPLP